MDIAELQERAPVIRSQYALEELRRYGRSWTPEEIMLGFLGDVGDLAQTCSGQGGHPRARRPRLSVAHELADCLWSIFTLADCYVVELEPAFITTMTQLSDHLSTLASAAESR